MPWKAFKLNDDIRNGITMRRLEVWRQLSDLESIVTSANLLSDTAKVSEEAYLGAIRRLRDAFPIEELPDDLKNELFDPINEIEQLLFDSPRQFGKRVVTKAKFEQLITKFRDLWWEHKNPHQESLWESYIILDEDFYRAITGSPVPVSLEILKQIKRSPLALDLYAWINYRTYQVHRTGKQVTIPLRSLTDQFGSEYNSQKEFNRKFKLAMAKIKKAQPGLSFLIADGAITIFPDGQTVIEAA
ncbi:MAG: hypothetical protein EOP09_03565 [Proteobacteria bacterium]|nr:MAG: hypothetical protein EOP09_03565 [Pseudomonadota bacterium]